MGAAVRELSRQELGTAAGVLARGMRDNPLHLRAFGDDPARRQAALERLYRALLAQYHGKGVVLGAFAEEALAGVCALVAPGRCRLTLREKLALLPAVASGNPLGTTPAVLRWTGAWARRDPDQPHWHVGPVGVERDRQGQGIGGTLLAAASARLDAAGAAAYLETDKAVNVGFYRRFGYQVTAEADVLGLPNWFMVRPGRPADGP
jgi:ribosomal protein S18 acetylase RimI-like enzyme